MARAPVIASIGELLVEFVCGQKDGHHLRAGTYAGPFPSGAPAIFIDQAARAGAAAVFAGAVGDDAFGQVITGRLAGAGVRGDMIRVVPGVPTGTAHVSYNSDGSRDFVFNMVHSSASRFPDGDEAVADFLKAGTEVLHISGSCLGDPGMRARIAGVAMRLASAGVALSLDPNIRTEMMSDAGYLRTVRDLMKRATYVLPSDADAALLFPGQSFEAWSQRLIADGAKVVALKQGADGAMATDGRMTVSVPGHVVEVVDPTGAGDCFCATFVTCLAAGHDLPGALARANAAGALAVTKLGPMEGNSTVAAIEDFMAAQAEKPPA